MRLDKAGIRRAEIAERLRISGRPSIAFSSVSGARRVGAAIHGISGGAAWPDAR
jgi:hypothetical protein